MAQKLRKMVMKRAKLCDQVVGAARVQGPEIGNRLGGFLSPGLREGETVPDQGATIRLYGRKLQGFRDAMVDADADYLKQRAAFADLQLESERSTGKLNGSILSLRSTCEGLLGKDSLRPLGLDFNIVQDPQGALRQGETVRERLVSSEGELTPERWVKASLVRDELVSELDGDLVEVRTMVRRLIEQRKVVDTAKVRKDQTLEEFDRQFIPIARVLEATFRVAGETELADRIRPTVRQLGRDDGRDEEEAESKTEPDSDSNSGSETEAPSSAS